MPMMSMIIYDRHSMYGNIYILYTYSDQLGLCQGVNVGIYGSPMECLGMIDIPVSS